VAQAYLLARLRFMQSIPGWSQFGKGWSARLLSLAFEARSLEAMSRVAA
jgi:hypothetical protein